MLLIAAILCFLGVDASRVPGSSPPLGLPPAPQPKDNPQTAEKIALGEKLFNDKRFSSTGEVSCATCHAVEKAFTDSPLRVYYGAADTCVGLAETTIGRLLDECRIQ